MPKTGMFSPRRSVVSGPIRLGFTTCTAMFANGVLIGLMNGITACRPGTTLPVQIPGLGALCAANVSRLPRCVTTVPRIESLRHPIFGRLAAVFALRGLLKA
jgi:hypothetical protein